MCLSVILRVTCATDQVLTLVSVWLRQRRLDRFSCVTVFFSSSTSLYKNCTGLLAAKRQHKHENPTNHAFQNPPVLGSRVGIQDTCVYVYVVFGVPNCMG